MENMRESTCVNLSQLVMESILFDEEYIGDHHQEEKTLLACI